MALIRIMPLLFKGYRAFTGAWAIINKLWTVLCAPSVCFIDCLWRTSIIGIALARSGDNERATVAFETAFGFILR